MEGNTVAGNSNLHTSRNDKADEFYTKLSLVESELKHYKEFLKGKVVFVIVMTHSKATFLNILQ